MKQLAILFSILVACLHIAFLVLEMFLWEAPFGLKTFGMTPQEASLTATLAFNQGVYNGFLAAGIVWSLFSRRYATLFFFLACVVVAGIVGALTAKPSIFFVQAMPAVLASLFLWRSSLLSEKTV
ncbi:membrane protein [Arenicella chitinivorans]|uniref:Membrane protein n=1 Tax=Arenicella chitinivorans TaxID=1329800 RepID=A0A918S1I5_9GAMM|nr:DUF1304 domain-containing protein [Arenicella chitinivorans]GHA17508.1 membrane protein [Arenicella chitinivorans]